MIDSIRFLVLHKGEEVGQKTITRERLSKRIHQLDGPFKTYNAFGSPTPGPSSHHSSPTSGGIILFGDAEESTPISLNFYCKYDFNIEKKREQHDGKEHWNFYLKVHEMLEGVGHKQIDEIKLRSAHKIDNYEELEVVVFVNEIEQFRGKITKEKLRKENLA